MKFIGKPNKSQLSREIITQQNNIRSQSKKILMSMSEYAAQDAFIKCTTQGRNQAKQKEQTIKDQISLIRIQNCRGQTTADPIIKSDLKYLKNNSEFLNNNKYKIIKTGKDLSISNAVGGDTAHIGFNENKFFIQSAKNQMLET